MTNERTQLLKASALKDAKQALKSRMDSMLRTARQLEQTLQRLDEEEATTSIVTHSDVFNWAVNDVENMLRNLNFAELCRTQARLEVAAAQ